MKLVNKKKRLGLIISIVAIALIAVIALVVVIVSIPKEPEEPTITMQGINIASFPKLSYYVGEEFDPSGISVQVIMSKQSATYFVDESELEFSGFDSSVVNKSLPIKVTYKGYSAIFNVEIKEFSPPPTEKTVTSVGLSETFDTTYTRNEWNDLGPNFNGVYIVITFSDGTTDQIPGVRQYWTNFVRSFDSACTYDMIVKYNYAGTEYTITVPITITN